MSSRGLLISSLVLTCTLVTACAPAVPIAAPSATDTMAGNGDLRTYSSPQDETFPLALSLSLGPSWDAQVVINDIDLVNKEDSTQWWGPSIVLLNGARVLEPAKVADTKAPLPTFDELQPLPDDLFAYILSIPGVTAISGPEPVTIGGVQGTQLVVHTPAMHPFLWLAGDTAWHGGGASGVEPDYQREMVLTRVNGQSVLLEYLEGPAVFDQRVGTVRDLFSTIVFDS